MAGDWRVGLAGLVQLFLGLVGDLLLVLDLSRQLLGMGKGIDGLFIIQYVALGAPKHIEDSLFYISLSSLIQVGLLDEPLVLLVEGSVLLCYHQIE